ncbi:MAG TPA: bifunctional glutamate N-acetyltransferase/amino-acid acetyltransferase ArgJ [Candidatus Altiarchaeales archaeon]|nr:bifunctional glutamate N-acetyltransferase/amino-acid acetyltransferase ArgJ [Candidatus Altiarchaeales archaeon]
MDIKRLNSGVCIDNFRAAGVREGKYGVAVIVNDKICETAGVFTKNNIKAAPALLSMKNIKNGFQAIVVNSGNANTCTVKGMENARMMCEIAGRELEIDSRNVGVASTGIIGRELDMLRIEKLIKRAVQNLSKKGSKNAAEAIMTTDTRIKEISLEYNGIKIGGICKGSGMIAPDLATMLCFLTTNADFGRDILQRELKNAVDNSFNMLIIDNDMSTNDTVILMSDRNKKCSLEDFRYILNYVCTEFARMMATDGEGVTKFLEIEIRNAKTERDAREGARAIASSLLVKTAIHGENPNWGRIIAALGSKIKFDFEKTDLIFESEKKRAFAVKNGRVMRLDSVREILKNNKIKIIVDIKAGEYKGKVFGCDLSQEYIRINSEYN